MREGREGERRWYGRELHVHGDVVTKHITKAVKNWAGTCTEREGCPHAQWNILIRDTFIQRVLTLIRRLSFIGRFL